MVASVRTFFITQKSLGGYAITCVTSPLLQIIAFHVVVKLRRKYRINVENFMTKRQAVVGNHYFDLTVTFQCTHF